MSPADTGHRVGFRPQSGGPFRIAHGDAKSVSALTDASGAVTSTQTHDAFGMAVSSSGDWSTPFQYGGRQGYQTDDTGLQLLGHRYYDPSTGRFLTRDPIKDGPNWYSYCQNDPINRSDPTGLEWHDPVQVKVDPGFQGKVIAYGDFEWQKGDGFRDVVVPPGHETDPRMDVDVIRIEHPDGRVEVLFLPGSGVAKDGVEQGSVYVIGADGRVHPPGRWVILPPPAPPIPVWVHIWPIKVEPPQSLVVPWNDWIKDAGVTGFPKGYEPKPTGRRR